MDSKRGPVTRRHARRGAGSKAPSTPAGAPGGVSSPAGTPDAAHSDQAIAPDPNVALGQVFLLGAAFSHRRDVLELPPDTRPEVGDVLVETQLGLSVDGQQGVVQIKVSTKPENNPVYTVQVSMMGLFKKTATSGMEMATFLENSAIAIVYPFLREAFANLTQRGRFGPVWLNVINPRRGTAGEWQHVTADESRAPDNHPGAVSQKQ
jgi:preprotein translocase subunit SecB